MSKRDLRKSVQSTEDRRQAYEAMNGKENLEEALWEALSCLSDQGIDIGSKATAIVEKRQRIRQRIQK